MAWLCHDLHCTALWRCCAGHGRRPLWTEGALRKYAHFLGWFGWQPRITGKKRGGIQVWLQYVYIYIVIYSDIYILYTMCVDMYLYIIYYMCTHTHTPIYIHMLYAHHLSYIYTRTFKGTRHLRKIQMCNWISLHCFENVLFLDTEIPKSHFSGWLGEFHSQNSWKSECKKRATRSVQHMHNSTCSLWGSGAHGFAHVRCKRLEINGARWNLLNCTWNLTDPKHVLQMDVIYVDADICSGRPSLENRGRQAICWSQSWISIDLMRFDVIWEHHIMA